MILEQNIPQLGIGVGCTVGRRDTLLLKPLKGREPFVVLDCRFEEVNNIFVLTVLRAIAWDVESAEASSVFAELVTPEPVKPLMRE